MSLEIRRLSYVGVVHNVGQDLKDEKSHQDVKIITRLCSMGLISAVWSLGIGLHKIVFIQGENKICVDLCCYSAGWRFSGHLLNSNWRLTRAYDTRQTP